MVSFKQAIHLGLRNYANFTGRSTRSEFWWWILFYYMGSIAIQILGQLVDPSASRQPLASSTDDLNVATIILGVLSLLYNLFFLVPNLAISVRRVRDTGYSLWWFLLYVAPIVIYTLAIVGGLLALTSGAFTDASFGSEAFVNSIISLVLVILLVLLLALLCYIGLIIVLAQPSRDSFRNQKAKPTATQVELRGRYDY